MENPSAPLPPRPVAGYLDAIESLLKQLIRAGRFELSFTVRNVDPTERDLETPECVVDFSGLDADLLLEKNGALLDALEYVVLKAVRLEEDLFGRITFDCDDWRRLRAEELKLTAQVAAERVVESGEPLALNPMSPRERRILHLALRGQPLVRTASEGFGPERRVVIHPTSPPPRRR
jgi:spoIIIJ-associated protein